MVVSIAIDVAWWATKAVVNTLWWAGQWVTGTIPETTEHKVEDLQKQVMELMREVAALQNETHDSLQQNETQNETQNKAPN